MNNDKALAALDEIYRYFDCLNPKQRAHRDNLVSIIRQSLTPQSSADLERVRETLTEYRKDWRDRASSVAPIDEALRILDEVIGRAE